MYVFLFVREHMYAFLVGKYLEWNSWAVGHIYVQTLYKLLKIFSKKLDQLIPHQSNI